MCRLLILGLNDSRAATTNLHYRGTERSIPYLDSRFEDEGPVRQAYLWYLEEADESGIVHDIAAAFHLVRVYREHRISPAFEVVEAVLIGETPHYGSHFLGYDLSSGFHNSLLTIGLDFGGIVIHPDEHDLLLVQPLLLLVSKYFIPRLNKYGLFDQCEDAEFCLSVLDALQEIRPGLFEYGRYEIVGLYEVKMPSI
jgi:hypothetical protein